nr:hypothetical protein CFP56_24372 [Quercus suber]
MAANVHLTSRTKDDRGRRGGRSRCVVDRMEASQVRRKTQMPQVRQQVAKGVSATTWRDAFFMYSDIGLPIWPHLCTQLSHISPIPTQELIQISLVLSVCAASGAGVHDVHLIQVWAFGEIPLAALLPTNDARMLLFEVSRTETSSRETGNEPPCASTVVSSGVVSFLRGALSDQKQAASSPTSGLCPTFQRDRIRCHLLLSCQESHVVTILPAELVGIGYDTGRRLLGLVRWVKNDVSVKSAFVVDPDGRHNEVMYKVVADASKWETSHSRLDGEPRVKAISSHGGVRLVSPQQPAKKNRHKVNSTDGGKLAKQASSGESTVMSRSANRCA